MKKIILGLILILGIGVFLFQTLPVSADQPEGTIHCEDWNEKSIQGTDNEVEYTAPEGKVVSAVCVKRGNSHTPWFTNMNPGGCYLVTGIGTQSVTVTKNEVGNDEQNCKDISHIDIQWENAPEEECEVDCEEEEETCPWNEELPVDSDLCQEPEDPEEPQEPEIPWPQPQLPAPGHPTPSAPMCQDIAPVHAMANFHVYRNGDQAVIKWVPTEGSLAHVYYKLATSANWEHSVIGTDNDGYLEINGLGNRDWTFAGQQVNGCAAGPMSNQVVDGNGHWVLFR